MENESFVLYEMKIFHVALHKTLKYTLGLPTKVSILLTWKVCYRVTKVNRKHLFVT
jgi:hypothetical protein